MGEQKLIILLLLLVSSLCPASDGSINDDSAAMAKLASLLHPKPPSWSSFPSSGAYCRWQNVYCNDFQSVIELNLSGMTLTQTLPPEFPSLPHLKILDLSNNSLSGSPPSLANLINLQRLYLDHNRFTKISTSFFQGLPQTLVHLSLSDNPFLSWKIPEELGRLTRLQEFNASKANVTGHLPDVLGSVPVDKLDLSYNNLAGSLPATFGTSRIRELRLQYQKIGLSGRIDVLSNMTSLHSVFLQGNNLTGPLPDFSKCTSLYTLYLHQNQLTGLVPQSLATLSRHFNVISLSNNKLQGPFPKFLLKVPNVSLDGNNFCTNEGPCDDRVTKLLDIAEALGYPLELSDRWTGNDACANWSFITCDGEMEKVISKIEIGNKLFRGTISPAFCNFTWLENLDLKDNILTGNIPDCLAELHHLKFIDVSNNNLTGVTPSFPPSVEINTSGNALLVPPRKPPEASPPAAPHPGEDQKRNGKMRTMIVIITVVSIVGAIGAIYSFFQGRRMVAETYTHKSAAYSGIQNHTVLGENVNLVKLQQELQLLNLGKLAAATNNFDPDNMLGQGGFGPVYWGKFQDGKEIAVKRLSRASGQGAKEFMNEVVVISKLRHKNLVRLHGCCIEQEEKMLVYEYMPKRSLDALLFDPSKHHLLDWEKRFKIIEGISRGLFYLHIESELPIIHRDLKASNILLDEELNPKISDFGMARIFESNQDQANTKRIVGTYGYMSPEYAMEGRFSEKSDVFSFGVLVLEIVSGRRNTSFYNDEQSLSLLARAWKLWKEDNILGLIDPAINVLSFHSEISEISRCTHVGLLCVQEFVDERPNMLTVISMLSKEIKKLPTPKQPAFTERIAGIGNSQSSQEKICSVNSHTITIIEGR